MARKLLDSSLMYQYCYAQLQEKLCVSKLTKVAKGQKGWKYSASDYIERI